MSAYLSHVHKRLSPDDLASWKVLYAAYGKEYKRLNLLYCGLLGQDPSASPGSKKRKATEWGSPHKKQSKYSPRQSTTYPVSSTPGHSAQSTPEELAVMTSIEGGSNHDHVSFDGLADGAAYGVSDVEHNLLAPAADIIEGAMDRPQTPGAAPIDTIIAHTPCPNLVRSSSSESLSSEYSLDTVGSLPSTPASAGQSQPCSIPALQSVAYDGKQTNIALAAVASAICSQPVVVDSDNLADWTYEDILKTLETGTEEDNTLLVALAPAPAPEAETAYESVDAFLQSLAFEEGFQSLDFDMAVSASSRLPETVLVPDNVNEAEMKEHGFGFGSFQFNT